MTNTYCAYAQKHLFDEIDMIDILDCNGGTHGRPFATNFNAGINIREVTAPARYFESRQWHEVEPLTISRPFDFPGIGKRRAYLMYHEELESLAKFVPDVKSLRFWMTLSERYLTHLEVIQNLGLSRIDEVEYEGRKVVPLKFLKSLLPDPRSLAAEYKGFMSIGCLITGRHNGRSRRAFLYNVCSHECGYQGVGAHAISYTTGVPAVAAATLISKGIWSGAGVFNIEQMDPDPLLTEATRLGLPWQLSEDIDWPRTE